MPAEWQVYKISSSPFFIFLWDACGWISIAQNNKYAGGRFSSGASLDCSFKTWIKRDDQSRNISTLTVNSGSVGVRNSDPEYALDVNGTIRGNLLSPSDQRWKENVQSISSALGTISSLRGVSYTWRANEFPTKSFPQGRQIGLIAQEVEAVVPELVFTDGSGMKGVYYQSLAPILIEAVKELSQANELLKDRIEKLENE